MIAAGKFWLVHSWRRTDVEDLKGNGSYNSQDLSDDETRLLEKADDALLISIAEGFRGFVKGPTVLAAKVDDVKLQMGLVHAQLRGLLGVLPKTQSHWQHHEGTPPL